MLTLHCNLHPVATGSIRMHQCIIMEIPRLRSFLQKDGFLSVCLFFYLSFLYRTYFVLFKRRLSSIVRLAAQRQPLLGSEMEKKKKDETFAV